MRKKSFKKKKVSQRDNLLVAESWKKRLTDPFYLLRWGVFLGCVLLVMFFWRTLRGAAQYSINAIGYQTVKLVSQSFWDPMEKDLNGNINVLFIGVGGENHAGGYLADTVIVASFDPALNTVSMISIPRDLFINYKGQYAQKINALFAWKYNNVVVPEALDESMIADYKVAESAVALAEKAADITWLDIPYYALIDFAWFEELIDTVGGIDIEIPYAIHDVQYPWPNNTYQTFSIAAWMQNLDGETALKYARSRKTTSDFSRSQRQQLIIKAVLKKLTDSESLTSVNTMKKLYEQYKKMVKTNVTARNAVAMIDYAYDMPEILTFGYTTECSNAVWRTMKPGCLLYFPPREWFNGMATMLPIGASSAQVSNYDMTAFFAYVVAHNAWIFKEKASIAIRNAIDPDVAASYVYRNGLAWKTAAKLRRYWFDVQEVDNDEKNLEKTTIYVYGTGSFQHSIDLLEKFIPTEVVEVGSWDSKHDIVILLGNDYVQKIGDKPFNYYR